MLLLFFYAATRIAYDAFCTAYVTGGHLVDSTSAGYQILSSKLMPLPFKIGAQLIVTVYLHHIFESMKYIYIY